MNELNVRKAEWGELPRIFALKQQIQDLHVNGRPDLFAPIADMSVFEENIAQGNKHLLLAEHDGQVIGYALLQFIERPANLHMPARRFTHVEEFCVSATCQRMGVGAALMTAVKQYAKDTGYPRIELDVWAFNEGAKHFYEAMGMKPFRYFMEMDADEG